MPSSDSDDLVPEDFTPRLKVEDAFAPSAGGRCMECPKHDSRRGWCPLRAEPRPGRSPMCRYGLALLKKTKE